MVTGLGQTVIGSSPAARELLSRGRPAGLPAPDSAGSEASQGLPARDRLQPANAQAAEVERPGYEPQLDLLERQRVQASAEAEQGRFRRQQELQDLPRENQIALSTYYSNQGPLSDSPSTAQLLGVDVFV